MKENPAKILLISVIVSFFIIIAAVIIRAFISVGPYEYEDFNGNIGTSKDCFRDKSKLFCKIDDNGLVEVVRFKLEKK